MGFYVWGSFFLLFDYGLLVGGGLLQVIPAFVGYLLLFFGTKHTYKYSSYFIRLRYFCLFMAIVSFIGWGNDLFLYSGGESAAVILRSVGEHAASLLTLWLLVRGLFDMDFRLRREDLIPLAQRLRVLWFVLVFCDIAVYCCYLPKAVPEVLTAMIAWTGLLAGFVSAILFVYALYRSGKEIAR